MKKSFILTFFLTLMTLTQVMSSCAAGKGTGKEEVFEAYRMRLDGKSDQAKALLEAVLLKDSTNAMAWYEQARLQHYMLIGGGKVKIENIVASIDKAVIHDPKNVIYAYYKGLASFLEAFYQMNRGNEKVKALVQKACADFEKVLKLKPDYYEAMLYLVEFYGMLPSDMGGDSLKAVAYAGRLKAMNRYFGAKAKAALLPEDADRVAYWEKILSKDPGDPRLMEELGKAYLFRDDPEKAGIYFDKARKSDPSKNVLILDLARYHIMKVMQDKDSAQTELPVAKEFLQKYLSGSPAPVLPLKAYALGLLVRVDMFLGNQAEAEKLMEETKALDPYFSRASGIPTLLLFDPPDKISHHYFSFFSPF